jgi:SAM-dependent methyltransferase
MTSINLTTDSLLGQIGSVFLAAVTSRESQNFLGAKWVSASLDLAPKRWKRSLALRLFAASPHYFFRTTANAAMSKREFLDFEYDRNRNSRIRIIDRIVSKYLEPGFTCLDYGCGPGFLASAAAERVEKVIACDISAGVLACAKTINPSPNIDYRQVATNGAIPVPDETIDLIYTFAVVQHVTDDVFKGMLGEFRRVLKPGRIVVCHVVVDGARWKTESHWREDRTVRGRIKWEFGLRCFRRSLDSIGKLVTDAGFRLQSISRISDLGVDLLSDDIEKQHLCILSR